MRPRRGSRPVQPAVPRHGAVRAGGPLRPGQPLQRAGVRLRRRRPAPLRTPLRRARRGAGRHAVRGLQPHLVTGPGDVDRRRRQPRVGAAGVVQEGLHLQGRARDALRGPLPAVLHRHGPVRLRLHRAGQHPRLADDRRSRRGACPAAVAARHHGDRVAVRAAPGRHVAPVLHVRRGTPSRRQPVAERVRRRARQHLGRGHRRLPDGAVPRDRDRRARRPHLPDHRPQGAHPQAQPGGRRAALPRLL